MKEWHRTVLLLILLAAAIVFLVSTNQAQSQLFPQL